MFHLHNLRKLHVLYILTLIYRVPGTPLLAPSTPPNPAAFSEEAINNKRSHKYRPIYANCVGMNEEKRKNLYNDSPHTRV